MSTRSVLLVTLVLAVAFQPANTLEELRICSESRDGSTRNQLLQRGKEGRMMTAATPEPRVEERRIREASTPDVDALVHLINAAFVVEQIAIEGDRIDARRFQEFMSRGKFLLLEGSDGPLGCVFVELRRDRGYVGLLSVEPNLQMKGLGRQLMAAAEEYFTAAGCSGVDLRIISARPELLRFYGKLGYVETGISPMPADAPLKMACHFIHLAKALR